MMNLLLPIKDTPQAQCFSFSLILCFFVLIVQCRESENMKSHKMKAQNSVTNSRLRKFEERLKSPLRNSIVAHIDS